MSESEDRDSAIRLIRINPTLSARLVDAAPVIEAACVPATDVEIGIFLHDLFPIFGLGSRSKEERTTWALAYLKALDGQPLECLKAAITDWNQNKLYPDQPGRHRVMPQPNEIFALSDPRKLKLFQARHRARIALAKVDAPKPPETLTPEERKEMAASLRNLGASLKSNIAAPEPKPTRTPQQVAAELRAQADQPSDDGEAI